MKIMIQSTDQIATVDGVPVRIWHGITEAGTRCTVMVHRLAVSPNEDATQFEAELARQLAPEDLSASWPGPRGAISTRMLY